LEQPEFVSDARAWLGRVVRTRAQVPGTAQVAPEQAVDHLPRPGEPTARPGGHAAAVRLARDAQVPVLRHAARSCCAAAFGGSSVRSTVFCTSPYRRPACVSSGFAATLKLISTLPPAMALNSKPDSFASPSTMSVLE